MYQLHHKKIFKKHKIIFIVTLNRKVYRQLLDECKYNFFNWSKLLKTETVYEILKYSSITENTLYVYI